MSIVKWDDSLVIGHDIIDAQHKKLFALAERLFDHVVNEDDMDMKTLIVALYKYTVFHFNEEETLMRKVGFPELAKHVAAHNEFIQALDRLADKAKHEEGTLDVEVLNWLVSWLVSHISIADKKLVQCLKR